MQVGETYEAPPSSICKGAHGQSGNRTLFKISKNDAAAFRLAVRHRRSLLGGPILETTGLRYHEGEPATGAQTER